MGEAVAPTQPPAVRAVFVAVTVLGSEWNNSVAVVLKWAVKPAHTAIRMLLVIWAVKPTYTSFRPRSVRAVVLVAYTTGSSVKVGKGPHFVQ